MAYQSSKISVVEELDDDKVGSLECAHNCHDHVHDFSLSNVAEENYTVLHTKENVLQGNCKEKRKILNKYRYGEYKILLGAAWMYPEAWRDYMRFPEVYLLTLHIQQIMKVGHCFFYVGVMLMGKFL